MKTQSVGAAKFKTHCLRYLNEMSQQHNTYIITKRGKAIAKLVPIVEMDVSKRSLYGCLKGNIIMNGDIMAPIDEIWDIEEK